jgi:hypothetical protein
MITLMDANLILKKLPPYNGDRKILIHEQSLSNVIDGIVKAAHQYGNQYNNIWQFFIGSTLKDTANNVWKFLKKNSDYVIEADDKQSIKSPAAIIVTGKKQYGGNDCKNFSLFTAGVLNSYRQATGNDFDLFLRFAGYNGGALQHVFVVIKKNNTEIWVDPVLNSFDDRTEQPTSIKDYKIEKMALISVSGVNPYENNKAAFDTNNPIPGSAAGYCNKIGVIPIDTIIEIGTKLKDLFSNKDVPGNYWMAWDDIDRQYGNPIGAQPQHWIVFDGDSIQNEALNVVAYIRRNGLTNVLSQNATTLRDFGRYITLDDLINKLKKAGFAPEADEIKRLAENSRVTLPGTTKAGTNMLITLALIGAAAFFLIKKK